MADVPATVDRYVESFESPIREVLAEVLRRVRAAAPDAAEAIRYGMPAFRLASGHPVYFAGWKQHVSLHDIPTLSDDLERAIAPFRSGKDTLKFRYSTTIPYELVERVVTELGRGGSMSG